MRQFVDAMNRAVADRNGYAALALALALPDMCGAIAYPDEPASGDRYRMWWARYMEPKYLSVIGGVIHQFLGGGDAWALRCAVLHLGSDNIEGQRAREALDRFEFVDVRVGQVHCTQTDRKLQLQLDIFCGDIADAVDRFLWDIGGDSLAMAKVAKTMTISTLDPGAPVRL